MHSRRRWYNAHELKKERVRLDVRTSLFNTRTVSSRTVCSERLCTFHSWGFSRPNCINTEFWSSVYLILQLTLYWEGWWTRNRLRSFPTWIILWFCDLMIVQFIVETALFSFIWINFPFILIIDFALITIHYKHLLDCWLLTFHNYCCI